jgi:hypothetical protein
MDKPARIAREYRRPDCPGCQVYRDRRAPSAGPRTRPDKRAKRFCRTIGTDEKGRGIKIKVPAAIRAANKAVRVIPRMRLHLPEAEMLLSLILG